MNFCVNVYFMNFCFLNKELKLFMSCGRLLGICFLGDNVSGSFREIMKINIVLI